MQRAEAVARSVELLTQFELDDVADRRLATYSSGTKLRLSLARALLTRPSVLLLDEPTRSLDPIATKDFRDLIAARAEADTAVLLATHDLHEAAAVASRIVIMANGRLTPGPEGRTSAESSSRRCSRHCVEGQSRNPGGGEFVRRDFGTAHSYALPFALKDSSRRS